MSKQFPWYKREPRAFFDATIGWPFEEKAAYGLLLDLLYMHDGQVANDSAYIVAMLGLSSKRKWTTLQNRLEETGKIEVVNGYLRNHRAFIETINRRYSGDKSEITDQLSNKNSDVVSTEIEVEVEIDSSKINQPSFSDKSVCQSEAESDRPTDPDFKEFWDCYPHVGNSSQPKALAAWSALRPADRIAALDAAKTMDRPPRDLFAWTWLTERHFTTPTPEAKPITERPTETAAAAIYDELAERDGLAVFAAWLAPGRVRYDGHTVHPPGPFFKKQLEKRFGALLEKHGVTIGAIEAHQRSAA